MNKIITVVILTVVVIGGFLFYKKGKVNQDNPSAKTDIEETASQSNETVQQEKTTIKEFIVFGKSFSFEPVTIKVTMGDTVKIIFKDSDGFHDLKIGGYNVATSRINAGEESSVQFVADKAGSFEYFCTVGNHRERGMIGTLVVE